MGRIRKGILGPVSGTVGTVIGSSWKSIAYLRSQPIGKKQTSTADQIDQQLKFSIVMNFVQTMTPLVQLTFKKYANKMSEFNAAFSYNFHNAIAGVSPDYEINFSKALVSRGDLPNATSPAATVTGNTIYFTWTDNSGQGKAAATDKAVVVAFCPNLNLTLFNAEAATRSAGAASLNLSNFAGQTVQTWIAFLSEDGLEAANSIFTGELNLAP